MTSKTDLHTVTGWLSDVANMTAGTAPLADMKPKIVTMASMLVTQFPIAAFCRGSLEAVASECRFFPPYADVLKHLSAWWRAHQPPQPTIAHPANHWERHDLPKPRDPPTEAEKAYVGEIVSALRLELSARQVSAAIASVKPLRPAVVMTDRQLLATLEAQGAGNGHRATMLRAKLEKELTP